MRLHVPHTNTRLRLSIPWLLLAALAAAPASAQSFNCANARAPQELLICTSPAMRALDSELGAAYTAALARLSATARLDVRRAQREWLAYWPTSCRDGRAPIAPRSAKAQERAVTRYRDRLAALRGDTLLAGDIRVYPVNRYLIGRSTAGIDYLPYAMATRAGLRVDLASVPPNRQPLALAIDRWLRADLSEEFELDTETDTETTLSLVPSLPFLLTLNTSSYILGHGAAHPVSSATIRHFHIAAGRPMIAEDILARPGWEQSLTTHVERVLRKELEEMYTIESSAALLALVTDPTRWSFDRKALTVNFNVYEVAPYAAGPQTVTVPWAVVAPWLSESVRRSVNAPR